jgi:8-oxo-dGTP diphosphatase
MARTPVLAAGGIVLRQAKTPLVAVVRLRKRNEWVLPKGKLDDGETPRAAAEREVVEETGHDVSVHEFLGTLVYESRGGSKVVHYWRMEARGDAVHELMRDVRAVDWLPLTEAVDRLSRGYERAFLENVGPIALSAAAHARRARAKQPAPEKRRTTKRTGVTVPPPVTPTVTAPLAPPLPDQPSPPVARHDDVQHDEVQHDEVTAAIDTTADASVDAASVDEVQVADTPSFALEIEPVVVDAVAMATRQSARSLFQRVRDWLRRAA